MRRVGPVRLAALLVLSLLVGLNLILPAGAHVTRRLPHLLSHLDPRYINVNETAANANLLDGQDSSAFLAANAKAADSDLLDGQNSTAFMSGPGKVIDGAAVMNPGTVNTLIIEPGLFQVEYVCREPVSTNPSVTLTNLTSGDPFQVFVDTESATPTFATVVQPSPNFSTEISPNGEHVTYIVRTPNTQQLFATVHVMSLHGGDVCIVFAQAVISS
jgi:hypothetical protein